MDGIVTDLYNEPYDVDCFVFSYKNRDKPSFLMTSLVENKYTSCFKKTRELNLVYATTGLIKIDTLNTRRPIPPENC